MVAVVGPRRAQDLSRRPAPAQGTRYPRRPRRRTDGDPARADQAGHDQHQHQVTAVQTRPPARTTEQNAPVAVGPSVEAVGTAKLPSRSESCHAIAEDHSSLVRGPGGAS